MSTNRVPDAASTLVMRQTAAAPDAMVRMTRKPSAWSSGYGVVCTSRSTVWVAKVGSDARGLDMFQGTETARKHLLPDSGA